MDLRIKDSKSQMTDLSTVFLISLVRDRSYLGTNFFIVFPYTSFLVGNELVPRLTKNMSSVLESYGVEFTYTSRFGLANAMLTMFTPNWSPATGTEARSTP